MCLRSGAFALCAHRIHFVADCRPIVRRILIFLQLRWPQSMQWRRKKAHKHAGDGINIKSNKNRIHRRRQCKNVRWRSICYFLFGARRYMCFKRSNLDVMLCWLKYNKIENRGGSLMHVSRLVHTMMPKKNEKRINIVVCWLPNAYEILTSIAPCDEW